MSVQVKKGDYQLAKIYQTYKNSISEYITISDEEAEQLGFKESEPTPDPGNNDEQGGEEQTQGWPVARFSFSPTNIVPQLHTALNTPGKYCTIILQDNYYIFFDGINEPYYYTLTVLDKKAGYILGLGGFIVGTNLNNEIVCYDLTDPESYINENITRSLTLLENGLVVSPKTNITYNLNTGEIDESSEVNGYVNLFKYKIQYHYTGNTLVITEGYDNEFSNNYIYECDYEIYEDENNDIILDLKSVNITDPRYSSLLPIFENTQLQLGKNIINQYADKVFEIYPYSYDVKYHFIKTPNIYINTQSIFKSLLNTSQSFDGIFILSHELNWYVDTVEYRHQLIVIESYDENKQEYNFKEFQGPILTHKGEQIELHVQHIINNSNNLNAIIYNNDITLSVNIFNLFYNQFVESKYLYPQKYAIKCPDHIIKYGLIKLNKDYAGLNIIKTYNNINIFSNYPEYKRVDLYINELPYNSSTIWDINQTYGKNFINEYDGFSTPIYIGSQLAYGLSSYGVYNWFAEPSIEYANTNNIPELILTTYAIECFCTHHLNYFAQLLDCQQSVIKFYINTILDPRICIDINFYNDKDNEILGEYFNYEHSFNIYVYANNKYIKIEIPF